tara:strand:- start:134 stop:544 length:411 start_codon:yes stop_codon:yes gene_type:complete
MEQLYNQCLETYKSKENSKIENQQKDPLAWDDRRKLAYDAAFKEIIIGAEDKIKSSMERGFSRSEIYKYYKFENKKFYGIYVSDILRKGDVMDRLNDHFSPFRVYLKRLNKEKGMEKDVINITWLEKSEPSTETTE